MTSCGPASTKCNIEHVNNPTTNLHQDASHCITTCYGHVIDSFLLQSSFILARWRFASSNQSLKLGKQVLLIIAKYLLHIPQRLLHALLLLIQLFNVSRKVRKLQSEQSLLRLIVQLFSGHLSQLLPHFLNLLLRHST